MYNISFLSRNVDYDNQSIYMFYFLTYMKKYGDNKRKTHNQIYERKKI